MKKAKLFFWTDGGGVPMVKSWKLQYADENGDWQDVKLAAGQSYTTMQGEGNEVRFAETVETNKLRVLFPKGAIVGATEFEAYALDPVSVDGVNRMVQTGSKAADVNLPKTVSASYTDGSRRDLSVAWDAITDDQLASDSEFAVSGTVIGALAGTKATIGVRSDAQSQTAGAAQPIEQTVYQNSKSVALPSVVPVRFPNGMLDDRTVMWDEASVAGVKLDTIGDYEVSGTAEGSSSQAKITVHVVADPNGGADPDPEPTPDPKPEPDTPLTGWIEGRAIDTTVSAEASWSPASGKLNDGVLVDDTWPSDDDADVMAACGAAGVKLPLACTRSTPGARKPPSIPAVCSSGPTSRSVMMPRVVWMFRTAGRFSTWLLMVYGRMWRMRNTPPCVIPRPHVPLTMLKAGAWPRSLR